MFCQYNTPNVKSYVEVEMINQVYIDLFKLILCLLCPLFDWALSFPAHEWHKYNVPIQDFVIYGRSVSNYKTL